MGQIVNLKKKMGWAWTFRRVQISSIEISYNITCQIIHFTIDQIRCQILIWKVREIKSSLCYIFKIKIILLYKNSFLYIAKTLKTFFPEIAGKTAYFFRTWSYMKVFWKINKSINTKRCFAFFYVPLNN